MGRAKTLGTCAKCAKPARARALCTTHYQADRRKRLGAPTREDLGPSPVREDFMLEAKTDARIRKRVGDRGMSAFLRRAARNQDLLERAAGKPVVL